MFARVVFPVTVVDRVAPAGRRLTLEPLAEGGAVEALGGAEGRREAGEGEQGGCEVDVGDQRGALRAGLGQAGRPHEQRHARAFLVHPALVEEAVLTDEESLVGTVDDDGVLLESVGLEPIEHATDVVVDRLRGVDVILGVALVGRLAQGLAGESGRHLALEVLLGAHVPSDGLLVAGERGGTLAPVIEQGGRFGDGLVLEAPGVAGCGQPVAVRRLEVQAEQEGLRRVAAFQPSECLVG